MQLNYAWRNLILGIVLLLSFSACSSDDDTDSNVITTKQTAMNFAVSKSSNFLDLGNSPTYEIEGNIPEWLTIVAEKAEESIRLRFEASENTSTDERKTSLKVSTPKTIHELTISQAKLSQRGIYILSEGTWKSKVSDISYYDITNDKLYNKKFSEVNGRVLGDVGNDLFIYGSKMYCLVSEQNPGTNDGVIEVIDPKTCKSIKQIPFVVDKTTKQQDIPRRFVFEGGKGYITGFSGFVARLDTLSLEIDAVARLDGSKLKPEGITIYQNKLYVANSGYGEGNTVSVLDKNMMKELYKIDSPTNPVNILTAGDQIYLQTALTSDPSNLYILDPKTDKVGNPFNILASKLTIMGDYLYTGDLNSSTLEDQVSQINIKNKKVTTIEFDMSDILTVYSFDSNPAYNEVYIGNMGVDVVITNEKGLINRKLELKVPYINKVVPVVW